MSKSRLSDYDWIETNSPVASSRTDDIFFFDRDTGWLVNSNGQGALTEDGGDTWSVLLTVAPDLAARPYLRTVGFANRQKGWVGALTNARDGSDEAYLEQLLRVTEDGGQTWTNLKLPKGSPAGICGLSVVDENVVYGAGSNDPAQIGPAVVKTTDGGQTWELIDMSEWASNLIDIHFFDESRGWVVGGKDSADCQGEVPPAYQGSPAYYRVKPVVLYTEDGGKSWENRVADVDFPLCGEWGWKLFFVSEQVFFVSLENFLAGAILKTLDGGQTWERLPINDSRPLKFGQEVSNANLEGIGFIDQSLGWVGGWGDASFIGTYNSVTEDGGTTWKAEDYAVNANGNPVGDVRLNVNRFRFFGDPVDTGYCSGKKVYKLLIRGDAHRPEAAGDEKGVFDLKAERAHSGQVRLSYTVPESAAGQRIFLGLWNQFGFYVRTLLEDTIPAEDRPERISKDQKHQAVPRQDWHGPIPQELRQNRQSVTWDHLDENGRPVHGAVCFRLRIGDRTESVTFPT